MALNEEEMLGEKIFACESLWSYYNDFLKEISSSSSSLFPPQSDADLGFLFSFFLF